MTNISPKFYAKFIQPLEWSLGDLRKKNDLDTQQTMLRDALEKLITNPKVAAASAAYQAKQRKNVKGLKNG
jgi:hypothetical protein